MIGEKLIREIYFLGGSLMSYSELIYVFKVELREKNN